MKSNQDKSIHQTQVTPEFREFLAMEIAELVMIGMKEQLSER